MIKTLKTIKTIKTIKTNKTIKTIKTKKMNKMITETEQAALNDFGLKIHRITWWEVNKFQMGYIEENGHVVKLRVLINTFSEKSRKMSYTSHCKNRADLNCVGLNFDNLPEAQKIEIQKNELKLLPGSIGNLAELRELDLSFNNLTTLPESFGNLKKLEKLDLKWNHLISLPESFGKLKTLKKLDLSLNHIPVLPESFGNLNNLENLNLEENPVTSFPDSFRKLKNLKNIQLGWNSLRSLSNLPIISYPSAFFGHGSLNLSNTGMNLIRQKKFNELYNYYKKTPSTLAEQYIKNPDSLTLSEKKRLAYESGIKEGQILERNLKPSDPILRQINERLSIL